MKLPWQLCVCTNKHVVRRKTCTIFATYSITCVPIHNIQDRFVFEKPLFYIIISFWYLYLCYYYYPHRKDTIISTPRDFFQLFCRPYNLLNRIYMCEESQKENMYKLHKSSMKRFWTLLIKKTIKKTHINFILKCSFLSCLVQFMEKYCSFFNYTILRHISWHTVCIKWYITSFQGKYQFWYEEWMGKKWCYRLL